jgi:hypothetical protein
MMMMNPVQPGRHSRSHPDEVIEGFERLVMFLHNMNLRVPYEEQAENTSMRRRDFQRRDVVEDDNPESP